LGHCNIKVGDIIEIINRDLVDDVYIDIFYLVESIITSSTVKGFDVIDLYEKEQLVFICRGFEKVQNIAWFKEEDKDKKWKIISS
jgi:hypothetical protein